MVGCHPPRVALRSQKYTYFKSMFSVLVSDEKGRKGNYVGGEKDGKATRTGTIKKIDGGKGRRMMPWSQIPKL